MFTLTGGKARTGRALGNPGGLDDRFGDLPLALRLLAGLLANAAFGTWWADPLAGLVIVDYALAVVPGEVGQAGDGGLVPDGGVGPVVVVVVQPGR